MKIFRQLKLLYLVISSVLITNVSFSQNIITVDNSPGANAQYDDIQTAIQSANNGDIIHLLPSEQSYGDMIIDKQLTIIGFSHSAPDKSSIVENVYLIDGASGSRLSGFSAEEDMFIDAEATLTDLVIEHCKIDGWGLIFQNGGASNVVIRGNVINSIGSTTTSSSTGASLFDNTIIENNIITDSIVVLFPESVIIKNNLFLQATVGNFEETFDLVVQNSIFLARTPNGSINFNSDGVFFQNCLAYNVSTGNVDQLFGENNITNIDPQFENINFPTGLLFNVTDDYRLKEDSIAIGAGVNGEDLGIFGGDTSVFNNNGFTRGVPRVSIESSDTTIEEGNSLRVTIKAKSN